jgi:hypothetical protein
MVFMTLVNALLKVLSQDDKRKSRLEFQCADGEGIRFEFPRAQSLRLDFPFDPGNARDYQSDSNFLCLPQTANTRSPNPLL